MTTPQRPVLVGTWPVSRLLMMVALVFFIVAALLAGGVISGDQLGWLLPAGLAAMALSFLVP